jgi:hypothetical protein
MQPRSITANLHYCSLQDPGLDTEHVDAEGKRDAEDLAQRYLETYDAAILPVKEGATLAVFEFEPLSRAASKRVFAQQSDLEQAEEAIALSLVGVTNFWRTLKFETKTVSGLRRVTPGALDALFGENPAEGRALFTELALVVLTGLKPRPSKQSG